MAERMNLPHLEGTLASPGRVGFDYSIGPSIGQDATLERVHIQLNAASDPGSVVAEIRDASSALATVTLGTDVGTVTLVVPTPPTVTALEALFLRLTDGGTGALGLSGWIELEPTIVVSGAGLTTLALVRAFRGTAAANTEMDALVTTKITAVSERMRRWMRREITSESPAPEVLSGGLATYGAVRPIILEHYPIQSVAQVDLVAGGASSTLAATDYTFHAASGELFYTPGGGDVAAWPSGRRNVEVTYTGGFVTVPADLVEAATIQVAWDLKRTGQGGDRLGSRSTDVGEGTQQYLLDPWAPEVLDVMTHYRRPLAI